MLRIKGDAATICNIEAYLFTGARNLANEHAALQRRRGIALDADDAKVQEEFAEPARIESQVAAAEQVKRLREVLRQLPPKCHWSVVLQYPHGLSYEEIVERLGVSRP